MADALNGVDFSVSVQKAADFISKCISASNALQIPEPDGVCFENFLSDLADQSMIHFPMKETKDPALSGANAQLQCRIFFAICYFDPALFYQHFLNFCNIKRMEILIRIPGIHGLLIQKCRFLHGLCEQLTAHERHPAFFKNGCAIYK